MASGAVRCWLAAAQAGVLLGQQAAAGGSCARQHEENMWLLLGDVHRAGVLKLEQQHQEQERHCRRRRHHFGATFIATGRIYSVHENSSRKEEEEEECIHSYYI
jgi:hypothetical protein